MGHRVIRESMDKSTAELIALVESKIGTFPDFPKPGIIFRDIFSALTSGEVCGAVKKLLLDHIRESCPDVDVIVGLEARGFLFSLMLAAELGCGTVPIRKKGKLPGPCIKQEYQLEYGTDSFEMQTSAIKPGQKVIILDDLLATGGTLSAALKLVRAAQAEVVECVVLMEMPDLQGRAKLDTRVKSFILY